MFASIPTEQDVSRPRAEALISDALPSDMLDLELADFDQDSKASEPPPILHHDPGFGHGLAEYLYDLPLELQKFPKDLVLAMQRLAWRLQAQLSATPPISRNSPETDVASVSYLLKNIRHTLKGGRSSEAQSSPGNQVMPLYVALHIAEDTDNYRVAASAVHDIRLKGHDGTVWRSSAELTDRVVEWYIDLAHQLAAKFVKDPKRLRLLNLDHEYEVLRSQLRTLMLIPIVQPVNTFDVKGCADVIWDMARIDRLPKENSVEALRALVSAWDIIDVTCHVSTINKRFSKTTYVILLFLGILTTTIATLSGIPSLPFQKIQVFQGFSLRAALTTLVSLLTSLCISVLTFLNPLTKWQQLRSAAQAMESEIWQFRTRTGPYSCAGTTTDREADLKLAQEVGRLRRAVLESAAIKDTNFFRERDTSTYRHGQRKGAAYNKDGKDNHYSVLRPEHYLELRVRPSLRFYQQRVPRYYAVRAAFHGAQLGGAAIMVVAAAAGWEAYTGIIMIVLSSLTAWGEFYGASKKLMRYSTVINALEDELLLWNTLTEVERQSVDVVEALVRNCELLIASEREGWLATSQTAKLLSKVVDRDSGPSAAVSVDVNSQQSTK